MNDNFSSCKHTPKKFRIMFDGGLGAFYTLILCKNCYVMQEKKFVIKEETLD